MDGRMVTAGSIFRRLFGITKMGGSLNRLISVHTGAKPRAVKPTVLPRTEPSAEPPTLVSTVSVSSVSASHYLVQCSETLTLPSRDTAEPPCIHPPISVVSVCALLPSTKVKCSALTGPQRVQSHSSGRPYFIHVHTIAKKEKTISSPPVMQCCLCGPF